MATQQGITLGNFEFAMTGDRKPSKNGLLTHYRLGDIPPPEIPDCLRGLTPQTLTPFLDRFFEFHKEHPRFDQSGIHILHHMLHLLDKSSFAFKDVFHRWMNDRTTIEEFHDPAGMITCYANIDEAARNLDRVDAWVQSRRISVPHACINSCLECFKFLLRYKLVHINGYDRSGASWLHVAIDCKNRACVDFLINNLTGEQINSSTKLVTNCLREKEYPEITPVPASDYKRYHPLIYLARARNQKAFEKIWRRFKGERIRIPRALLDDKLKAQLRAFVTPDFAEYLRMDGFDIYTTKMKSIGA